MSNDPKDTTVNWSNAQSTSPTDPQPQTDSTEEPSLITSLTEGFIGYETFNDKYKNKEKR